MARKKDKGPDKTLAMRVLEGAGILYEVYVFPDTVHDATEVARHAGVPPEQVYKTLVVEDEPPGSKPMLIMVAANRTLNLKKTASAVGAKKVHMARHVDAERMTGLQTGGISALALLNRGFKVYLDLPALDQARVLVSAGKRGINLSVPVEDLMRVTGAEVIEATDD